MLQAIRLFQLDRSSALSSSENTSLTIRVCVRERDEGMHL